MIFAPSVLDKYASLIFPSLSEILIENNNSNDSKIREKIKYEISIIIYAIQSACHVLQEPLNFQRYI